MLHSFPTRRSSDLARLDDFAGRTEGLVALSGGVNGLVEKALRARDDEGALAIGTRLRELFPGRFYLELQHHLRPEDGALVQALVALARRLDVPYVATNGVAYVDRERYRAHGDRVGRIGAGTPRGRNQTFGDIGKGGKVEKRRHCRFARVYAGAHAKMCSVSARFNPRTHGCPVK